MCALWRIETNETNRTPMLNKILDNQAIAIESPAESDKTVSCPVCQCPIQWRATQYASWTCYDCEPPANDSLAREARILAEVPGGGIEWRTLRPRPRSFAVVAAEVDFESLPEPMPGNMAEGYKRWMARCARQV